MRAEDILKAIASTRDRIIKEHALNNPYLLSERMAELALFNHMLSDIVAEVRLEAKSKQAEIYATLKEEGNSSNQAMILSKINPDVLAADFTSERIDNTLKQTTNLITACQSHIKAKLNEIAQQSVT